MSNYSYDRQAAGSSSMSRHQADVALRKAKEQVATAIEALSAILDDLNPSFYPETLQYMSEVQGRVRKVDTDLDRAREQLARFKGLLP